MINLSIINPEAVSKHRRENRDEKDRLKERAKRERDILAGEWSCLRISDDGSSYDYGESDDPDGIMIRFRETKKL